MIFGALTLIGFGATILLQGGWQAAAAGFALLNGAGFVLSFAVLGARSERPRSRRPSWERADRSRGPAAVTAPRHLAAPRPETSQAQPSGRRPRPARRTRTV